MFGIPITVSDKMMPRAWIAYDADGRAIGAGVIGVGHRWERNDMAAKYTVGTEVWAELRTAVRMSNET